PAPCRPRDIAICSRRAGAAGIGADADVAHTRVSAGTGIKHGPRKRACGAFTHDLSGAGTMAIAILFGVLALLLVTGVPVAFALISAALATVLYLELPPLVVVQQTAAGAGTSSL